MANLQQEYPLVLLGILEELANMRNWLSFQDLCRMVSTRFDLEHLVELRSLLFAAASRDPCFPATLFRDRVTTTRGLGLSPIGVAADIVTIFNLIQMTGGAPDDQLASQPMRAQTIDRCSGIVLPRVDQLSFAVRERTRVHADAGGRSIDRHFLYPKSSYSAGRKRGSLPPEPISLLAAPPVSRARAVSFDWPNNGPLFPGGQLPSATMQSNIYLPLETDSESSADSATMEVFEAEQHGSAVGQRRDVFKKDFHNQPPLVPQVTVSSESPSPDMERKRSFERLANPYASPTPGHRSPPGQRAKHESLDDLQDSTYFGPGSISEWSPHQLQPSRNQKSIWSNKSHSLEDRMGQSSMGMELAGGHLPRRSSPAISNAAALGGESGDSIVDRMRAMATQTDPPDHRHLRSLVHADRLSFMTSLDDPEFGEDDISAIFRFLDEVSMCGSTGVLHPNDGVASVNQDTPEARRGRLGQLQRLFHSLESSDDGVKASVYKLLLRMSQIERQLESLTEVKAEISQVLSALQRLDDKIPQPAIDGTGGHVDERWLEPLSAGASSFSSQPLSPASESSDPQPLSVYGHLFSAGGTGSLDWNRGHTGGGQQMDSSKAHANPKRGKEGKEGKEGKKGAASRRVSKTQSEEKGGLDSKRSSVSHSARDWAVSFSKSKSSKDTLAGKIGKMDQSNSTTNLLSAQKPTNLMEQVFNSALFRQTESSLTGGMTSGKIIDPRMAEGRTRPVWTVDESQSRIASLDLHAQDSLNPNNMEFWMEDIYTPGYDALLRRKEADLRRAKFCKLAALIAIAVAIILIIVIPICTMGS